MRNQYKRKICVQILVGHTRIETTTRYTHLTQKEVGEAVKESVEALFRLNRQMTDFEWEQLGADPNVVEALGFEPRSKGLFHVSLFQSLIIYSDDL